MSTADTTFSDSLKVRLQFPQGGTLPNVRAELQGGRSKTPGASAMVLLTQVKTNASERFRMDLAQDGGQRRRL